MDGYAGCEDTELDQWANTTNKSTDDRLRLRSPDIRAVLIRFDLAPIPPQATITQARLELYATWGTGGRPINR